ncbi:MAG: SDR family NAD(P)-dependent oxidoreductase [Nostoc sp.]|uniref:SDR family NAD(P)-dependent oxidoreductase n=1 Tax=Nostoc sp. TaxID=1180 RepID=UPI002FFBCAE6
MDLGLKDKVVVVTGVDSGIGKMTAKLFTGEGTKVTIIDKTSETLQLAAEELKKSGEIFTVQADLTQPREVDLPKSKYLSALE